MAKMKLVVIVICMMVLFSAVGAENFAVLAQDNTSGTGVSGMPDYTQSENYKASIAVQEYFKTISKLQSSPEELAKNALEWAKEGVKYHYLYNQNNQAHESYFKLIKGMSVEDIVFTQYSKSLKLHAVVCTVDFVTSGYYDGRGLEKTDEQYYSESYSRAKVLVMCEEWNGVAHCIGIKYPGEYREEALGREVYTQSKNSRQLNTELLPLKDEPLPVGFTSVALDKTLGGHDIPDYRYYQLSDSILAGVYSEANAALDKYRLGVLLFDHTGKKVKDVSIAELKPDTFEGCEQVDGKLYLYTHSVPVNDKISSYTRYIVDAAGKVSKENNADRWGFRVYSSDGKQYAYVSKNCVYVVSGGTSRKLITGKTGYEDEWYQPLQWLDSTRLLIEAAVDEAPSNIEVLDTKSGKLTSMFYGSVMRIKDGKLYGINNGYDGDGTIAVYDLNNPKAGSRVLLKPESNETNYGWNASAALSPDCKTIAFFHPESETIPNNLRVYSLESGKKLKDVSFYCAGFGSKMFFFTNSLAGILQNGELALIDMSKISDQTEKRDEGVSTVYTAPEENTAEEPKENAEPAAGEFRADANVTPGFHHKSYGEFCEAVVRGDYTTPVENLKETACRWAETDTNFGMYAGNFDTPVEGYNYATTKATCSSDYSFPGRCGEYVLHVSVCKVMVNNNPENTNLKYVISAEKDGVARLLGFDIQRNMSMEYIWDIAYAQALCYPELEAQLVKAPVYNFAYGPEPSGVSKVSLTPLFGESYPQFVCELSNGALAAQYQTKTGEQHAVLFDRGGKRKKEIKLSKADRVACSVSAGKLICYLFNQTSSGIVPVQTVAMDGTER